MSAKYNIFILTSSYNPHVTLFWTCIPYTITIDNDAVCWLKNPKRESIILGYKAKRFGSLQNDGYQEYAKPFLTTSDVECDFDWIE